MPDKKPYSLDIWDYLDDMPYMPSRADRDQLLKASEKIRAQIWDYFFRIDPDDVGKPQKSEMADIDKFLSELIFQYNRKQQAINSEISFLQRDLFQSKLKNSFYGIAGLLAAGTLYIVFLEYNFFLRWSYLCITLPGIYGVLRLFTIGLVAWRCKNAIRELKAESRLLSEKHDLYVKEELARKNALRDEIKALKRQIPIYPPGDCVRDWLNSDFLKLYRRSIEVTALDNRLVDIESDETNEKGEPLIFPNPIYVLGPGELQQSDKIPSTFTKKRNPDLNKHLSAKRSYYIAENDRFDVLYGVYYVEHILIADDMLATNGLFYDFITGKHHAEQITEQYYQDVVAITTTHESREISSGVDDQSTKYVEDAPTFTLSLSSGEHRTVTFVNQKYFMEFRENLNVNEDDIARISWIKQSRMDAEKAGKALRSQLRLHKIILDEE